jgi:replicative DNA helicase
MSAKTTKGLEDFLPDASIVPDNQYPLCERIILVALHFNNAILDDVAAILPDPAMFSHYFYGQVYATMLELGHNGKAFDLVSVAVKMKRQFSETLPIYEGLQEDLWWMRRKDEAKVLEHARIVADAFVRRQVAEAVRKGEETDALLARLGELQQRGEDTVSNAKELVLLAYEEAHADRHRMPYPFGLLQTATSGGIKPEELIIVAGRPGTGKTAWLLQVAWKLAHEGKRVLFASAEMGKESLMQRICSHIAGRNLFSVVTDQERDAFNEALEVFGRTSFTIQDLTAVEQLKAHLDKHHEYDVVFVDYLQQLHTRSGGKGEFELVTSVTRQLDAMSKMFHLPFVVASQFSRAAEGMQPSMASLRSSGQIEQAADVIISLWSKPEEQTDPTRAKVYMDILKNRNGFTVINGAREYALWFDKPVFTFRDIDNRRAG